MGIPPFCLVRRLGLSCRRASRVVSSDEWEASKTAGASRLVSVSSPRPVIHAAGGSSPGASWCSRRVRHRLAISSPASKQAAAAGRSRGVGRGLFFQAVGKRRGRNAIPSGGVSPFRRGGNDTGGRRHALIILTAVSHSCLASYPSSYRKDNTASKQAGRAERPRRSYPGGQRRTSKQDENSERPRPVSSIIPRPTMAHEFHLIPSSTQSPRPSTSKRREEGRDAGNDGTETNTGTTGERRNEKRTSP